MLTLQEAKLFARAGDDMRWKDWPADEFVRFAEVVPIVSGYEFFLYAPTPEEIDGNKWTRA